MRTAKKAEISRLASIIRKKPTPVKRKIIVSIGVALLLLSEGVKIVMTDNELGLRIDIINELSKKK